jgi:hypothetical protein
MKKNLVINFNELPIRISNQNIDLSKIFGGCLNQYDGCYLGGQDRCCTGLYCSVSSGMWGSCKPSKTY